VKFCRKCHTIFPDDIDRCVVDNTKLEAIVDPFIGKLIGGCYRITAKIADGGMSRIYSAKHMYMNREVAVKVLKPMFPRDDEWRKRTVREARICGSIEHRNIVRVYDMLMADGSMCIVMELLEGDTLKNCLKKEGKFDLERVKKIMSMTADALARAHALNIVHRDIKPSNIFLTTYSGIRDFVKLLDFGIAFSMVGGRLTGEGLLMGTPPYTAPEQIQGKKPIPASDIYSLGCVAYEMITGATPFVSKNIEEIFKSHIHKTPAPPSNLRPDVPGELNKVLMKMLEKNPGDRFSDAFDLLYTLKNQDLYRSGLEEERVEIEDMETEEVRVIEMPTAVQWGAYFQNIPIDEEDPTCPSESIQKGVQAVTELSDLEKRTREIIQKIEAIEAKRRNYRKNIGNAIAILGWDLSRVRVESAKTKLDYLKTVSERDHMVQKINSLEERIAEMYEARKQADDLLAREEELRLLSRAGRAAKKLSDLRAKADVLQRLRKKNKDNVKDMKYQILQLADSLSEVEEECSKEYETYRKMLDETAGKGERLRKEAAFAAYEVGTKKM
jgi:serine/threonine protein kinase